MYGWAGWMLSFMYCYCNIDEGLAGWGEGDGLEGLIEGKGTLAKN